MFQTKTFEIFLNFFFRVKDTIMPNLNYLFTKCKIEIVNLKLVLKQIEGA